MSKIKWNNNWYFTKHDNEEKFKAITLPHDAMLYESRDPLLKDGRHTGYFPGGKYIYKKNFTYDPSWKNDEIYVEFEGIYQNATIFVNNKEVYFHPYGYSGFYVQIDQHLHHDKENQIVVEVDNSETPNSRWYSGSGIYRDVFLHVKKLEKINFDGVKIITKQIDPAIISVEVSHTSKAKNIVVEILDNHYVIARKAGDFTLFEINNAELWSDDNPYLYQCRVLLYQNRNIVETMTIDFGIRLLEWKAKQGLLVNHKPVKLRGCAIHHDNGILGAVDLYQATERKLKQIKAFGYNAIRSAHNPCSKNVLQICDRLGLYIMDEAFDMWYLRKNRYDYGKYFNEWHQKDLEYMVLKDRNHPSVIMYSIGNEVVETAQPRGVKLMGEMNEIIKTYDQTRPVTCGISLFMNHLYHQGQPIYTDWDAVEKAEKEGGDPSKHQGLSNKHHEKHDQDQRSSSERMNDMANRLIAYTDIINASDDCDAASTPAFNQLDIAGYNYATIRYEIDNKKHPNRLIVGTETELRTFATNWERTLNSNNVVGDFIWVGYQYIGEAGFGAYVYPDKDSHINQQGYPWLTIQTYVIDFLGNISEQGALVQSVIGKRNEPYIAVKPLPVGDVEPVINNHRGFHGFNTWSWEGYEGKTTTVWVVSDASYVDLYINKKLIKTEPVIQHIATFKKVVYQPGSITAVALDEKKHELYRSELRTADTKPYFNIVTNRNVVHANNEDLCYIEINVKDRFGTLKTDKDYLVNISVDGPLELLSLGSTKGFTDESFVDNYHYTYMGKLLAVLRAKNLRGQSQITISSDDIGSKVVTIDVI